MWSIWYMWALGSKQKIVLLLGKDSKWHPEKCSVANEIWKVNNQTITQKHKKVYM